MGRVKRQWPGDELSLALRYPLSRGRYVLEGRKFRPFWKYEHPRDVDLKFIVQKSISTNNLHQFFLANHLSDSSP